MDLEPDNHKDDPLKHGFSIDGKTMMVAVVILLIVGFVFVMARQVDSPLTRTQAERNQMQMEEETPTGTSSAEESAEAATGSAQ